MSSSMQISSPGFNNNPISPASHEKMHTTEEAVPSVEEFVPEFELQKEALEKIFNIEVPYARALDFPWVKDELYAKVKEGLENNEYFALDFMIEENLLTKKDLQERKINTLQDHARVILHKYKGPRLVQAKKLFITAGLFTEKEIEEELQKPSPLH